MNSSFSTLNPRIQTAIDSTSLGAFKTCPRYYQLSILDGWAPQLESVHLTFGLLAHATQERYHHFRSRGQDHEAALSDSIHWLMKSTWSDGRPWTSTDSNKNRFTLVRTMVWYLDQFGQNDPIKTIQLSSGKPAVELSFRFDSSLRTHSTDEPIVLCGHLDRIGTFQDQPWIVDFKTTKSTINQQFFDKFTPFNQFTLYILAGKIVYNIPVNGVIVDGAQVAVTFSRFERQLVTRSEFEINEWLSGLKYYLREMEECALTNYWPMNDRACDMYGGCPYRSVCSKKSPESQRIALQSQFKRRTWDPLQTRGDI